MKIAVLSGSPKGDLSITLQYVKLIQKKIPEAEIIDHVRNSDGVLWTFPVYVFLVPSQYKRFIDLIWERGAQDAFQDKYTAVLTTSIHFYDHTAHNYMHAICDDLGMRFVESLSADIDDIFTKEVKVLKGDGRCMPLINMFSYTYGA